jgi:hypothetical protein
MGSGTVVDAKPRRDPSTKLKYWDYSVRFGTANTFVEKVYQLPADECTIVMFPGTNSCDLPHNFPLAPFKGSVEDTLGEQKKGVQSIIRKLDFAEHYPSEALYWETFWNQMPEDIESIPVAHLVPFNIPHQQLTPAKPAKTPLSLRLDDGVRPVEPVQHSNFTASTRKRKEREIEATIERVDPLKQGDFIVLNLVPDMSPWYTLPFVFAEIEKDISHLDTTDPDCRFEVQVYRPNDKKNSLKKRFIKWQGEDNVYWKPTIERGIVLSTVQLGPKSKKLSRESLQFVEKHHLNVSKK